MNHIYPLVKGDQLCPLGFHPQVRWPTRCKRCFRDYKEHGNKRNGDDITASSPALSSSSGGSRMRDNVIDLDKPVRSWTSTQNLTSNSVNNDQHTNRSGLPPRPASWASTPDLENLQQQMKADVSISIALPRRRHTTFLDNPNNVDESPTVTIKRPPIPPSSFQQKKEETTDEIVIAKSDSLAERVRKMQIIKRQGSLERELSAERVVVTKKEDPEIKKAEVEMPKLVRRRIENEEKPQPLSSSQAAERRRRTAEIREAPAEVSAQITLGQPDKIERRKRIVPAKDSNSTTLSTSKQIELKAEQNAITHNSDVQFLIQIKDTAKQKKKHDDSYSTCTETTDTTLVGQDRELQEEIEVLKRELEVVKSRCERAERDKSDILLRRLASMDTTVNRTAASEALKLQQKVNELKQEVEELRDDKKVMKQKVKELQDDLGARPNKSMEEQLRVKLEQAETLCEELMDENEDIKRELRNMETEIDEMHDNFREDQADEYSSLKKELEQTTKNCRILSFKLKKSDRKIEQLETEKQSLGLQANVDLITKIKKLEEELKVANEVSRRLQRETELNDKSPLKKKAPTLGKIGKSTSADGKISRESLTRGGSQEDPVQLLRDLQDSLEREADLREQLKFAEEEGESLRKKASRVEDENDTLVMQLKKMANKARSRKLSPTPSRLTPEPPLEKDEGISDEDDPSELRLQLELNEQETAILRRKTEELERESEASKRQIRDLQESVKVKETALMNKSKFATLKGTVGTKDPINEKKIQVMEEEMNDIRKKLIEKDREFERLQAEFSITKGKPKGSLIKSKSLEVSTNDQSLDLKRQLQVVEQEATVLRTKTQTLEQENDKLLAEVKKLQLQAARGAAKLNSSTTSLNKIGSSGEITKLKESLETVEKERDEISAKLKKVLEQPTDSLGVRVPKKFSENLTKLQLKKMMEELEDEVAEMRAIALRSGADKLKLIESEKTKCLADLKKAQDELASAQTEIKTLKTKSVATFTQTTKIKELEEKLLKFDKEKADSAAKIKLMENTITKNSSQMKQTEATKTFLELQIKSEKDKLAKAEKTLDLQKVERNKLEARATDLEAELQKSKKAADTMKATYEKELLNFKNSAASTTDAPSKRVQELLKQIKELEDNFEKHLQKHSELTGKYELLEEEHVLNKAKLNTEKDKLQYTVDQLKSKVSNLEGVEKSLKTENSSFSKRIGDLQKKCVDLEGKDTKIATIEYDKNRLKTLLEEKQQDYDNLIKENEMNIDLSSQLKKDNEDLRKKLDDFEKINKVQRTLNDHNSALEQELKKLKIKLDNAEISVKSEVAATRLRYEQQITNLQAELNALQRQCERFKKDRDSFKQLLEAAQKKIGDLKTNRRSVTSISSGDEDDKSKLLILEQQIGCFEDELSEARLETSKLRTELVSEKSAAEIKISEMQSRLNEYEEERILGGGGRTKVPGTKTRLELSWQKEREEQQRLLQETSTLARDLRQTLFEVERERDKERLESRRKVDQVKKTTEEELDEGRRKISELQSDLLELRDAHAKLRTANEKLRRDRDRYERERDSVAKRRLEQDGERKVGALLQTVDELVKIAPELQMVTPQNSTTKNNNPSLAIPNPPKRSKSRSPSPQPPISNSQISTVLARLAEASEELRRYQRICDDEKDRDRMRRGGIRRAASTENDNDPNSRPSTRLNRHSQNGGSLYRKSLSLDQSMQAEQQQMIWKQDDDSMSSMQSIDSEYGGMMNRDSSLDSRLSGGSTQSDMPRHRKKKRGLMGKLRSLAKGSKGNESDASHQGSDSDLSLAGDHRSSKKDLKNRLSGMFRRGGSQSRSGSTEVINESKQRPVAITTLGSNGSTPAATPHLPRKPPTPSTQRKVVNNNNNNTK